LEHSSNVIKAHEDILNAIMENKREKGVSLLENHLFEVKNRLTAFNAQQKG
jgi:DNA-binding FadR family transcriptional regulator